MDEQTTNHKHLQANTMTMEQIRQLFEFSIPVIPSQSNVPASSPSNWQPGSSFGFLHPQTPEALPYKLFMPPMNSMEQVRPPMSPNIPFFQAPHQSQSFASEPSKLSKKRNQIGGGKSKEHWTFVEDVELCVAWTKISEDPIVRGTCCLVHVVPHKLNVSVSSVTVYYPLCTRPLYVTPTVYGKQDGLNSYIDIHLDLFMAIVVLVIFFILGSYKIPIWV